MEAIPPSKQPMLKDHDEEWRLVTKQSTLCSGFCRQRTTPMRQDSDLDLTSDHAHRAQEARARFAAMAAYVERPSRLPVVMDPIDGHIMAWSRQHVMMNLPNKHAVGLSSRSAIVDHTNVPDSTPSEGPGVIEHPKRLSVPTSRQPVERPLSSVRLEHSEMCNVITDWLGPTSYGINNSRLKCCCQSVKEDLRTEQPPPRGSQRRLPALEVRSLVAESNDLSRDIQKLESALASHQKKQVSRPTPAASDRSHDAEVPRRDGSPDICVVPKRSASRPTKPPEQIDQRHLAENKNSLRFKKPTDHLSPKVVPGPGTFRTGVPVNKTNTRKVYLSNDKSHKADNAAKQKSSVIEHPSNPVFSGATPLFTLDNQEEKPSSRIYRKSKEIETWIDVLNRRSGIFDDDDDTEENVYPSREVGDGLSSPVIAASYGVVGGSDNLFGQDITTASYAGLNLESENSIFAPPWDEDDTVTSSPNDGGGEVFYGRQTEDKNTRTSDVITATSICETQHVESTRGSKSASTATDRSHPNHTDSDIRNKSAPHRNIDRGELQSLLGDSDPEQIHSMRTHLNRDEPQLTENCIRPLHHAISKEARAKVLMKKMKELDIENRLKDCKVAEKEVKDSVNQSKQRSCRSQSMESITENRIRDRDDTSSEGNRSEKPQCDPEVALWLKELKLKDTNRYLQLFAEHEIDMDSLLLITEDQLKEIGIKAIGAFNKILIALQQLRKKHSEDEYQEQERGKGDADQCACVDMNTTDAGDIPRPRLPPKVQTNKTSLLRKNMREAKVRNEESKRPWQNPNRNGTVRSKIDTGLRDRSETDLLLLTGSSSRPAGSSASKGQITARRSGQRTPLRAGQASCRQISDSAELLQSSSTRELGSSHPQRPQSEEDCLSYPESWMKRETHKTIVEVRPLGFEESNTSQKLGVEYSDDSDSDVAPMRIEIRQRGSSPSRQNISDKLPVAMNPTEDCQGGEINQGDSTSATEDNVEKEPESARKKPPPVMAKPVMKQRITLGVAQFGAHFDLPLDPREPSIVDDRKLRRSPETDAYMKLPPSSRKPSSQSAVTCRVDATNEPQCRRGSATLSHLHTQLQELQCNIADESAMEMIQQLQQKLEQLHQHMSPPISPSDGQHLYPPSIRKLPQDHQSTKQTMPKTEQTEKPPQSLVLSALQGNIRPKKRNMSPMNQDLVVNSCDSGGQPVVIDVNLMRDVNSAGSSSSRTSTSGTNKQQVLSNTMKKNEILREVRKQKEDYRRQIKHLESELTRLKHSDPLQRTEVLEEEVMFNDSSLIGEGAFSLVFRGAYHGSDVAVKRLKVPLNAQDKNYFMAEVSILHELRHPRVVLLLGVCTTTRLPLMVLEYLPKGSLYSYLHDTDIESLDHMAFYQLARDMALGMNYLHEHRPSVLHLDLKSMNVLLTAHLRAKIADFGFSKLRYVASEVAHKADKKSGARGTPAWMAPELLESGDISNKADVYSFGMILWEMLTRRHPYQGQSVFQILEKVRGGKRPEIPKSCPAPLSLLINRSWNQNAGKRPAFRDIVPMLERMHFPPEWRQLFMAAGIPSSVLEDVESTRTLVEIITTSLDQDDLRLQLCETDSGRGVSVSPPDILAPCVTVVKALPHSDQNDSGTVERSRMSSKIRDSPTMPSEFYLQSIEAVRTVNIPSSVIMAVPPTPPPVPPLPPLPPTLPPLLQQNDLTSNRAAGHLGSFGDDLTANLKRVKLKPILETSEAQQHAADKDEQSQRAGFLLSPEELTLQKQRLKSAEGSLLSIRSTESGGFHLDPAALVRQKGRLRQLSAPEPSQLTDLSHLQPEKLSGLADVLRKAICGRRAHLKPDVADSIDQSAASLTWSISDD